MEESILAITAEMHARLARLLACPRFGHPPGAFRERKPGSVYVGKATHEQQALAILYNQVHAEHWYAHKAHAMPFGVNPRVPPDHFRNHVMIPVLFEMLMWSVHRTNPDKDMQLESMSIDKNWRIFAVAKPQKRKKKS